MSPIVDTQGRLAKDETPHRFPEHHISSILVVEADTLSPTVGGERQLGMDVESPGGVDYVTYLETELFRYRELSARSQRALLAIQASHGWKILLAYYKLRNLLLPINTRRHSFIKLVFKTATRALKTCFGLRSRAALRSINDGYARWIRLNEPHAEQLEKQRSHRFVRKPKISIIVPTFNPAKAHLQALFQSVAEQTYTNWELCIADASAPDSGTRRLLKKYAAADTRVRLKFLAANQGISGNSNEALALAAGDYVTFLDHDDTLAPFALHEVVRALNDNPDVDFLYSDEDILDDTGRRRFDPHFKPDWSPETLRSHNYICHLTVLDRALLDKIGGFRPEFDGSQDYDLILRATEQAQKIVHIPKVLYHWRQHARSTPGDDTGKMYAYDAGRRAVQEHLRRLRLRGQAKNGYHLGTYQVVYPLTQKPLISIIIPTRDQHEVLARCLESIEQSHYPNREILLVENHSLEPETFAYYRELEKQPRTRILTWEREFNYAAVNNYAATQARGEVLLFLNNDTQAINPDWIERMLEHALRPQVGIVGAKLYYPDNTVQHSGVVIGIGGIAGHVHRYFPREAAGYCHRLITTQNVSVVTGACLMMRKDVFVEVGGFDERFILAFNDVDLCVRVRQKGWEVIWTPYAELYHFESKTRGLDDTPEKQHRFEFEINWFLRKWGALLEKGDAYYNPNLTLQREDFSLNL